MIGRKERQVSLYYLNNLMSKPMPIRLEESIINTLEAYSKDLFGMDMEESGSSCKRPVAKMPSDKKTLREVIKRRKIVDIAATGYDGTLDTVFKMLKIGAEDRAVLRYMAFVEKIAFLGELDGCIRSGCRNSTAYRYLSNAIGITQNAIKKSFSRNGQLFNKGIICDDGYDDDQRISKWFRRILENHAITRLTEDKIRKLVVGPTAKASLRRDNFIYIAEGYDHTRALLENAVKARRHGVNILLYGIPGTGKTELCKSVARDAGANLYMLSNNAEKNDKSERLSELLFAQNLLEDEADAVILFDEAEDLFTNSPFVKDNNSKLFFNRMLERNKTPVIWISNDIKPMDPAYIRRFKYAFKVEKPDSNAKEAIWENICAKRRFKLTKKKISEFARTYDVAPSIIDTAVDAAAITGTDAAIGRTIEALHQAAFGNDGRNKNGKNGADAEFIPELLNTDADLTNLTEKLVSKGNTRFSLCLYGESGTGKSAYASYLAERLGMEVIHERASDIMSCWVGGTEENIAAAFRKARKEKAMLIFDEADSFLRDRKTASRSWEATQVNEMLTWMEDHPYPFVCTTNLMDDMDQASLRRFTFKVQYNYMKAAQVRLAFKHFFGIDVGNALSHLTHLTPGDFAVVKAKRDVLDITDDAELIAMLENEQAAKGVRAVRMGFA